MERLRNKPTLIDSDRSQLLIVDAQERLAAAMHDRDETIRNISILLRAAEEVSVPVVMSEQYPQGLGHTVPELKEQASQTSPVAKVDFSCLRNTELRNAIEASSRKDVLVAGIEAHICVLQTAFDLLAEDYRVFVVADAVASRRPESKERGLRRMEAAGATIVTTEMIVFEWLASSASPAFKTLSKLIR